MCVVRAIPAAWDFLRVGSEARGMIGAWRIRDAWDPRRVG